MLACIKSQVKTLSHLDIQLILIYLIIETRRIKSLNSADKTKNKCIKELGDLGGDIGLFITQVLKVL